MKIISKQFMALVAAAMVSTTSFAQSEELKVLPIFNDDTWKPNFELAAVTGSMDYQRDAIESGIAYGLELSFDCPVFTLPGNNLLRQQLNLNRYSKNGLRYTSIEMNPYYFVDLSKGLVLGFGPGIGAVQAKPDNASSQWLFAVQAGTGIKYYFDDFLIGADLRYQWTAEKNLGPLNNTRLLLKAGYRF